MRGFAACAVGYVAACMAVPLSFEMMTQDLGGVDLRLGAFVFVSTLVFGLPGWLILKLGVHLLWPERLHAGWGGVTADAGLHAVLGAANATLATGIAFGLDANLSLMPLGLMAGSVALLVERAVCRAHDADDKANA